MCRSIGRFHAGRLTVAGLCTSEGHPDLSGVWDFGTLTPLEQPVAGSE